MYIVTKAIDVDFAHRVDHHQGPCINLHGHTWRFEVTVGAQALDELGMVVDFQQLKAQVLQPIHDLLDHGLVLSQQTYEASCSALVKLSDALVGTLKPIRDPGPWELFGAKRVAHVAMKIVVFPFAPTCERLSEWLFQVARGTIGVGPVGAPRQLHVLHARVIESLSEPMSYATYTE